MTEQKLGDEQNQEHKACIAKVKGTKRWSSVPGKVCKAVRTTKQGRGIGFLLF